MRTGETASMNPKMDYRPMLSWLVLSALFVLCGILGYLQYRWTGEVSMAARDRLRAGLQAGLNRLSRDFDAEIAAACHAILPPGTPDDVQSLEAQVGGRYREWRKAGHGGRLFDRVALALPRRNSLALVIADPDSGVFHEAEWPAEWVPLRISIEARLAPGPARDSLMPGGGPRNAVDRVFEVPVFRASDSGERPGPFGRRETGWAIFSVNLPFVREVLIPELLQHHLGTAADYQAAVVTGGVVIYESDPGLGRKLANGADGAVRLFDPPSDQFYRTRPPAPPDARDRRPGAERGPGAEPGRWQMFVRHRAGSLEAVVARTRRRNLAVSGGILVLLAASAAALISFTRRAQKLALLQMEFVAGVSHELRTPLTVIHTAAHNLQGKLAGNPGQVERYGALIQTESGKLKDLVEQVLLFARSNAGRAVQKREVLSAETLVEESLESTRAAIEGAACVVETKIAPALPPIAGDAVALKQAIQNLLGNAAKYGADGGRWIGVFVSPAADRREVEIRVADRGRGIPPREQARIFEPFFRGRHAVERQIHGTGLGLSLVKEIVEAHGGSVRVRSEPGKGTEFIVLLPALPPEQNT
jgi:signal transduction histidine kinase